MIKKQLNIILTMYLLASPALSLADLQDNDPSRNNGYRLVTLPSRSKEEVETMLGVIRTEMPRAEINKIIEKREFYRLVAGRFNDAASAIRMRSDLSKKKIPSFIMKSKNRYSVIISSHISNRYALDEQKLLARKKVKTDIVKFNNAVPHWQINSGEPYQLRDAVYAASLASLKNVITTIE